MTLTPKIDSNSNVLAQQIILQDLDQGMERILDFGSGLGFFTNKLIPKVKHVYGCDIDKERIRFAKRNYKKIFFTQMASDSRSLYKDNYFDCVILLGVLEHVNNEDETLSEISRILKPGGSLYIYGINKGLFGPFDAANLKFLFPGLHKLLYIIFYGKSAYDLEFGNKQGGEMFGDFTFGKKWHSHYSIKDLDQMTKKHFVYMKHWQYGLFEPFLRVMEFVGSILAKRTNSFLWNLIVYDSHLSLGSLSYSFVYKCRKR